MSNTNLLIKNIYEKDEIRYTLQAAFFKTVFKLANVFKKTDSDVFKKYTKEVMEIFKLDEENIGQLIYFFEKAVAMSGKILGVNPFNQPGVEKYKQNMFKLLNKPGY